MFRISASYSPFILGVFLALLSLMPAENANAQCYGYQRYYSSTYTSTSGVSNEVNAVGSNLTDFSSISIPSSSLIFRHLRLQFAKTFTGGESIHVKLENNITGNITPVNVEIQAYSGSTPVGTAVSLSSGFLGLASGQNIGDILVTSPGSSYDGVQITVQGNALASGQVMVYAAYVNELITTGVNCNTTADVIYGSTSGLLGGANTVVNPNNAADNDLTTYATLNQALGVLGYVHVTSVLPAPTVSGDSISVTLKVPGSLLLDAGVFSNMAVVMYLGNTQVGTIPANDALIKIRLLDAINGIYRFTYPASYSFDRISVQAGGVATALSQIYVYDIRRIIPKPRATIDGNVASSITFCAGGSTVLGIENPQSCTTYQWYDAAVGGNLVFTGTSFARNNLAVGTYNYYVEAVRTGCLASSSERTQETITVNPLPTITLGTNPTICIGATTASLPFTATTENPTTYSITWSTAGLTNVVNAVFPGSTPITIAIAPTATVGTYNGTITVKNGNNCTGTAVNFSVTINAIPATPTYTVTSN